MMREAKKEQKETEEGQEKVEKQAGELRAQAKRLKQDLERKDAVIASLGAKLKEAEALLGKEKARFEVDLKTTKVGGAKAEIGGREEPGDRGAEPAARPGRAGGAAGGGAADGAAQAVQGEHPAGLRAGGQGRSPRGPWREPGQVQGVDAHPPAGRGRAARVHRRQEDRYEPFTQKKRRA
jgi:hypothetical protein